MNRDIPAAVATGALIGGIISLALAAWIVGAVCLGLSGLIAWKCS